MWWPQKNTQCSLINEMVCSLPQAWANQPRGHKSLPTGGEGHRSLFIGNLSPNYPDRESHTISTGRHHHRVCLCVCFSCAEQEMWWQADNKLHPTSIMKWHTKRSARYTQESPHFKTAWVWFYDEDTKGSSIKAREPPKIHQNPNSKITPWNLDKLLGLCSLIRW